MSMFEGTTFEPILKGIMERVVDTNRAERAYVISPEERRVIDRAIVVRSRIVEIGLTQAQFNRAEGKRFWTSRLQRKFGTLPTLAFREDMFGRLVVDTPSVVSPIDPDVKYFASVSDTFPEAWCEQGNDPWTNSMWFEIGMFKRSEVKISSMGVEAEKSRPEFRMAEQDAPRVHDSRSSWEISMSEEGVSVPYYVSPERLQVASEVLELVMVSLK